MKRLLDDPTRTFFAAALLLLASTIFLSTLPAQAQTPPECFSSEACQALKQEFKALRQELKPHRREMKQIREHKESCRRECSPD